MVEKEGEGSEEERWEKGVEMEDGGEEDEISAEAEEAEDYWKNPREEKGGKHEEARTYWREVRKETGGVKGEVTRERADAEER